MPDSILTALKLLFLALLYLFFFRVLRAMWVEATGPSGAGTASAIDQETSAAARPAQGRLRVLAPAAKKGQAFDLGGEVTVGRASGCHVSLPDDATVSQLHARVFRRDGRWFVEDLGSTNGTLVNRRRAQGEVPLRRGDRIQVGETVLELMR